MHHVHTSCTCAVELLSVNDELNNAFERFAHYEQRRNAALSASAVQEAALTGPTSAASASANSNSPPLIGSPLAPGDASINTHPADATPLLVSGALHPDLRELAQGVETLGT